MTSGDGGTTFVAMEMNREAALGTKDGPFRQECNMKCLLTPDKGTEHVDSVQISNGSDVLKITHTGSGGGDGVTVTCTNRRYLLTKIMSNCF